MRNHSVGVVGCGYWGQNLVRNFAQLNALAAVCDQTETQAHKFAAQYQVPALSWEALLKSVIEAVVIAAPASQHFPLTQQALLAGKHVFVEKPLSLEITQAQALVQLSQQVDKTLMVGHLLQYHPVFLELKQLIAKGTLGKLQYIYSNRLNLGKFRNEENILWSFAPHDISMILALAGGLPDSVYATGTCHLNSNIQDVTTTHLTFKHGLQAHIFVSWLHPYKEQKLVVVGDRGMAVFDDGLDWGEKLKWYPHQVNWVNGFPTPEKADLIHVPVAVDEPLKLECQHFIDCFSQSKRPRTDGEEGLRVLQVLQAAQTSLSTKKSVAVNASALTKQDYFVHDTALVDEGCEIGNGSKVWHFSHLLKGSRIGRDCVIGQNAMIGPNVMIGDRCKIQNNVSLYQGVILEEGVFCGPSCVFTNVMHPRAEIERKDEFLPTIVGRGATIGANATIVCGNDLGAYSFIGAGAVVIRTVKPHALMVGNPARQIGWVSHAGEKLGEDLVCPREGRRYQLVDGQLELCTTEDSHAKSA